MAVIELLLFLVFVLLFLSHWLWSFRLFLFTVSLSAIRLPCFNKLEWSWVFRKLHSTFAGVKKHELANFVHQ